MHKILTTFKVCLKKCSIQTELTNYKDETTTRDWGEGARERERDRE